MWPRGWVEVLLYSSMTAALEGGEWSAASPGRILPPGKTRHPLYRRLGGSHGRSGQAENLVPTRIRSRTVQPVVSRYTDWATRRSFFLGTFAKSRRATFTFISVCPSARMKQLVSHWKDFYEILYLRILRKFVDMLHVLLQPDKNDGYITWRQIYVFDHISLISFQNEKCFRQKL